MFERNLPIRKGQARPHTSFKSALNTEDKTAEAEALGVRRDHQLILHVASYGQFFLSLFIPEIGAVKHFLPVWWFSC